MYNRYISTVRGEIRGFLEIFTEKLCVWNRQNRYAFYSQDGTGQDGTSNRHTVAAYFVCKSLIRTREFWIVSMSFICLRVCLSTLLILYSNRRIWEVCYEKNEAFESRLCLKRRRKGRGAGSRGRRSGRGEGTSGGRWTAGGRTPGPSGRPLSPCPDLIGTIYLKFAFL